MTETQWRHRFGVTEGTISRIVNDLSWRGTEEGPIR
jgi:hypothetical protein